MLMDGWTDRWMNRWMGRWVDELMFLAGGMGLRCMMGDKLSSVAVTGR